MALPKEKIEEAKQKADEKVVSLEEQQEEAKRVEEEEKKAINEQVIKFKAERGIEKSQSPKNVKWIVKNQDKIRFDLAIQRNKVWKLDQKSLFIHSLLYGYPFPPCFAKDTNDKNLWLLDGQQRVSTVVDFVEGRFNLSNNTPDLFGIDISGLGFDDLYEELQDEILDTPFTIWQMKNMTEDETDEMFLRLNNGSPLHTIELTRVMASSELMKKIEEIAGYEFFSDKINLTSNARNRFRDQELILQILSLLAGKNKGFGSKQLREFVMEYKDEKGTIDKETENKIKETAEYLNKAVDDFSKKELKKALKKIHVPMIFMYGIKAKENKISPQSFGGFIKKFLVDDYKVGGEYGSACSSGSAKKENVNKRLRVMGEAFDKTFITKGNNEGVK